MPWWAIQAWLEQQTQIGYERFYKAVSENRGTPRLEDLVPELSAASTAIADVIDEAVRVEYNVQFKKLLIHLSGGRILEPSQLSAGYRTLLALISDLARRCVLLNPAAGARAPYETPGLVLIDELELHLHPKWQRQVVKGLQRAFPKIQFVCTTHSPQILSEAPADSVVLLGPDDTVLYPKYTHGRDANAILEEILGTPARPVEIDALFGAFRGAIDERRWAEAEQLLGRLESALGSDTAEVISAHWSLEVQRSPESEASAEDAQSARSER
ncbi:MAG TPA: AAA family ATPase [Myxococcota bacterium]|nr:AAA family ATPase [Myxococcota bacterium]